MAFFEVYKRHRHKIIKERYFLVCVAVKRNVMHNCDPVRKHGHCNLLRGHCMILGEGTKTENHPKEISNWDCSQQEQGIK